jgi:hypothetical protein
MKVTGFTPPMQTGQIESGTKKANTNSPSTPEGGPFSFEADKKGTGAPSLQTLALAHRLGLANFSEGEAKELSAEINRDLAAGTFKDIPLGVR